MPSRFTSRVGLALALLLALTGGALLVWTAYEFAPPSEETLDRAVELFEGGSGDAGDGADSLAQDPRKAFHALRHVVKIRALEKILEVGEDREDAAVELTHLVGRAALPSLHAALANGHEPGGEFLACLEKLGDRDPETVERILGFATRDPSATWIDALERLGGAPALERLRTILDEKGELRVEQTLAELRDYSVLGGDRGKSRWLLQARERWQSSTACAPKRSS